MKPLSNTSVRVPPLCAGHSEEKVSHAIERDTIQRKKGQPEWAWGKVPLTVSRDARLSRMAIAVYVEMAWACWATAPNVEIGGRLMAERLGVGKNRVYRALQQLVQCGHIERFREAEGRRMLYRMKNEAFEPLANLKRGVTPRMPKSMRPKLDGELPEGVKSVPKGWRKEKAG